MTVIRDEVSAASGPAYRPWRAIVGDESDSWLAGGILATLTCTLGRADRGWPEPRHETRPGRRTPYRAGVRAGAVGARVPGSGGASGYGATAGDGDAGGTGPPGSGSSWKLNESSRL